MLTHTFFARAPVFLVSCSFRGSIPLFLREQRITVLEKIKTVAVDTALCTVCVCYYRPSFFYDFRFQFFSHVTHIVCLHISEPLYFFDRGTAYRCLPLLYLQSCIETYLADFISSVLDDRILKRYFGAVLLHPNRLFSFCSHLFLFFTQSHIPSFTSLTYLHGIGYIANFKEAAYFQQLFFQKSFQSVTK